MINHSEIDGDEVVLSQEAMKALQEFYSERDKESIEENWQLSQFWYTQETSERLANIARSQGRNICCLSAPTAFRTLHTTRKEGERLVLLEFDKRFGELYAEDFVFYDYKDPLAIPNTLRDIFDVVIADPPFLAEECLKKVAETIRFLTHKSIIVCTGVIMKLVVENLLELRETSFKPQHARKLGNEFGCFTNFDING
ncbi:N(6)-adenine-specific DNA methyltransferase 2-like [Tropilaelaps mercedesae]|uniref:Protein-lysine N-methyltransferase BIW11_08566 n=1 Tax=Tropilaelaps mercedesae TaxID=418985 RepID=A0A1V9XP22_9ACAR|nr:N(6)-adenine-specific DNA methyltransferase 2-like [Tropilaelaps mercedesae]